jgi:hypothetical protein
MMHVDPFRLAIALVPLAAYLLLLALVNLRRRPFLTSGGSDLAALGVALSGLAFVGPIELFRPEAATTEFGNFIWPVMVVFYWLWVLLAVLVGRPRLVVYNVSSEELHPVIAEAASRLDPDSRWAGSSLALPNLGVQLHMESFDLMRNVSLASSGSRQNLDGWRELARALAAGLKPVRVKPNPRGIGFLLLALALMAGSLTSLVSHPKELAYAVEEVFAY